MSGIESARIWLVSDRDIDALDHVKSLLEGAGAQVEMLDLSEAVERVVREQGSKLLDSLKVILRRTRRPDDGGVGEDEEAALSHLLARGRPDMIVVAADKYLRGLDMLSRMAGGGALRVGLLPDYNLSASWLKGALHAYIVPHDKLRAPLMDAGVDGGRIVVAGPPVGQRYQKELDGAAMKAAFGIDPAAGPVVLMLVDRMEPGDIDKVIFQMSLVERPWQPIFVAGAEQARAEKVRRAARRHGLQARMLGEVANLEEFMGAAELVGMPCVDDRVVSALALDRPALLLGDPGPVTTQTDFLLAQGAVWHVGDLLRLGGDLEVALREDRLDKLRAASSEVGHPTGTTDVVAALVELWERRAEIVRAEPTVTVPDAPATSGPFEVIGGPRPDPSVPPSEHSPDDAESSPSPLSAAEAKDELAALIMLERDLERQLASAGRERETWQHRLDLARDWNEVELTQEAEAQVARHVRDAERATSELERVRAQKDKLKARVRQGTGAGDGLGDKLRRTVNTIAEVLPAAEQKFRDMEVERDLSSLRERLRKELED